ncbi:MAG: fumarylacetoacetase [Bacteroidota bacterium]
MNIPANDPSLKSWVSISADSDFSLQNLPFGVFKTDKLAPRMASAIGDYAIDLDALHELGYFEELHLAEGLFLSENLNPLLALGQPVWRALRQRLSDLFNADKSPELAKHPEFQEAVLYPMTQVEMLLPVYVRDYTDFYSSVEHATNVGTMFRGAENALMPNWKHLPVGYHGRASSIIVSGTDIHRPKGQYKPADATVPQFGPSRLVDFELEMAYVIGTPTALGDSLDTASAERHVFGLMLFNDWSARDIQGWEYVPLGPFLGKSFASSVSPWIVTLDALEPFRTAGPTQNPPVLPYLQYEGDRNLDIELEVWIEADTGIKQRVCQSNHKYLYWNIAQQVAHHTVNGCNLNVGDMMASGTISGPDKGSFGSMLEITWRGANPVSMPDGTERKFIGDGDSVVMKGWASKAGVRVGFGEVRGKVLPAK